MPIALCCHHLWLSIVAQLDGDIPAILCTYTKWYISPFKTTYHILAVLFYAFYWKNIPQTCYIHDILNETRPKAAYGRQRLDWPPWQSLRMLSFFVTNWLFSSLTGGSSWPPWHSVRKWSFFVAPCRFYDIFPKAVKVTSASPLRNFLFIQPLTIDLCDGDFAILGRE